MSKAARRCVSIACALVLAVSLLGMAPLKAIADTVAEGGGALVYQEAYGVIVGDYAIMTNRTVHTEVYDGGSYDYMLTSEDIVRSDGTRVLQTEQRQYEGDYHGPVAKDKWSQYTISDFFMGREDAVVLKETATDKEGLFTLEGEVLIPCVYDTVAEYEISSSCVYVARLVEDEEITCDIYSTEGVLISSIDCGEGSGFSFSCGSSFSIVEVYSLDENGRWSSDLVRYCILDSSNGSFSLIDECVSYQANIERNLSAATEIAYLKSDGTLWRMGSGGAAKKQIASGVDDETDYGWCGGFVYGNGEDGRAYYDAEGERVGFLDGKYADALASGDSVVYYDESDGLTKVVNTDGEMIGSFGGGSWSVFGNCLYTSTWAEDGSSYTFYKPDGTLVASMDAVTGIGRSSSSAGTTYSIYFADGTGKTYDADLNEIEASGTSGSTNVEAVLADGTELYIVGEWVDDGSYGSYVKKVVDANGELVVRNGYTIVTTETNTDCCAGGWSAVKRPGMDMLYAVDSEGRYGAIDSYGNVLIPFEYDRIIDAGRDDTDLILLKKDGEWLFYDVVNKVVTNARDEEGGEGDNGQESDDQESQCTIEDYVKRLYKDILGNGEPTDFQVSYWAERIKGGRPVASVVRGMCESDAFANAGYSDEQKVAALYAAMLGVYDPTSYQLDYWSEKLGSGEPLSRVVYSFARSEAFQEQVTLYGLGAGELDAEDYVMRLYNDLLGVDQPNGYQLSYWADAIASGTPVADVVKGFCSSAAFEGTGNSNERTVELLYSAMLGNYEPSSFQLDYWTGRLDSGESLPSVIDGFAISDAFAQQVELYGLSA